MNPIEQFNQEKDENIKNMNLDKEMLEVKKSFIEKTVKHKYSYNFTWLGRPIIQFPQDMVAMQELIWKVQPDLIIEAGIAHGGSLFFYASMLELLGGKRRVLGIDIDIRKHNRKEIENHPMFKRITMIEGSSIDKDTIEKVFEVAQEYNNIMLVLDSFHSHDHVLRELEVYSELVERGSYITVFDTAIDDLSDELIGDRPWGKNNNPKTAVHQFLTQNNRFVIDKEIENKLLITGCPDGYLKCIK